MDPRYRLRLRIGYPMWYLVLLVFLVLGCGITGEPWHASIRTLPPADASEVARVREAWGSELPPQCTVDLQEAVLETPAEACQVDSSCLVRGPMVFAGERTHVIVLPAGLPARARGAAVRHETIHLLLACTSLAAGRFWDVDPGHKTPGRWAVHGDRESLEARLSRL